MRSNGRTGGGVALFIKDTIPFKIRNCITTNFCESVFIQVFGNKNKHKTISAVIYRAPNTDFQFFIKEFQKILQISTKNNTKCILADDFNVHLLNQSHFDTGNFINMLFSYSVLPEMKAPTRYSDSSMTLIDNNFTNKSCNSHVSGVILNDISDHLPIFYITGNMQ